MKAKYGGEALNFCNIWRLKNLWFFLSDFDLEKLNCYLNICFFRNFVRVIKKIHSCPSYMLTACDIQLIWTCTMCNLSVDASLYGSLFGISFVKAPCVLSKHKPWVGSGFLVGLNHNLVNNLVQCGLKYQYGWGWAGFCTRGIGLGGVINRRKHVWTGVGLVQISAHCQVELERREYTVTRTKWNSARLKNEFGAKLK
jgi:hypothetical protein